MNRPRPIPKRLTLQGFTLMEVVVASSIVGIVFLVTIPLLVHVRQVRQEADRRAVALQEAANVMEQVAVLAMRQPIDADTVDEITLSPAAARLPEPALDLVVRTDDGPLRGTRVMVSVGWKADVDEPAVPATLSAWFPEHEGR